MSDFQKGSFDAAKFQDVFGLSSVDESKAYKKGSSTGTKQTAALGTYLTKDDYNRLKDSDQVWEAYASVNGSDAMEKKRKGGSLSVNALDGLMDDLSAAKQEKATEETAKEPFDPVGKSDDHKAAEENYDKHFDGDSNPWDTTSAVDSYQSAFDRVTAAGKEMNAGEYLRQRADDKKGGVNRFNHYLTDHNTLAAHESHRASMNAIKKAGHVGLEPPALLDPGDLYDRYKGDIDSIGDDD